MKVVICGIGGKMGGIIASLALEEGFEVIGGIEKKDHPLNGKKLNLREKSIPVESHIKNLTQRPDVIIDFSSPDGVISIADQCYEDQIPLVTGTTGLGKREMEKIFELSKIVPVVQSPNMSIGVNILFKLCSQLPRILGPDYDVEIVEIHHRNKEDAPSGTALKIYDFIKGDKNLKPVFSREGRTGKRGKDVVGIFAVRGGDVVGEHTVYFLGSEERIELTHRASSRAVFARGALRACRWIAGKPPGLYSMFDVLGI